MSLAKWYPLEENAEAGNSDFEWTEVMVVAQGCLVRSYRRWYDDGPGLTTLVPLGTVFVPGATLLDFGLDK